MLKKKDKQYKDVFQYILKLTGAESVDQPFEPHNCKQVYEKALFDKGYPEKDGLFNPDDVRVQLILWLFTMEPTIYWDVMTACREVKTFWLETLGPLAFALHWISQIPPQHKGEKEIVGIGKESVYKELQTWSNTELLYRGVRMRPEWIEDWQTSVGIEGLKNIVTDKIAGRNTDKPAFINMQGITSTTESLSVALRQAQMDDPELEVPVVFVISLQNINEHAGFRLSDENMTSHISDKERLLKDGIQMWVLDIEEKYIDKNDSPDYIFKDFQESSITFIHLSRMGF